MLPATAAVSQTKPTPSRAGSPSRLPQKTPTKSSPSKLKQAATDAPAPSSPFMSFSPVVQSARGSRLNSPTKVNSSTKLSFDDEFDPFNDAGDESVCSNFSDVTAGAYNTASQGLDKVLQETAASARKSPVKSRPQTPIRRSPTKAGTATPQTARPAVRAARESSPSGSTGLLSEPCTPKAAANQTGNLLLDFTQQFDAAARYNRRTPSHRRTKSASPRKGSPSKVALPPATPTESRFFNLLDFSPGPTVTPRSIPSITPREVEELKAGLNSQISLLNAQLGGREVEVTGLRTAVEETEGRCADLSNALKEQKTRFEDEKGEWQKIKVELGELFEAEKAEKESMSIILIEKEQVVEHLHAELENKDVEVKNLKKRLRDSEDELERTREEVLRARTEASEATAAAAAAAAVVAASESAPALAPSADEVAKKAQEEVERVARELHTLYKAKHETKVAALKKSYEGRWEKKVNSLQQQVEELTRKNEELKRDAEEKKAEELTADMSFSAAPGSDEDLRRELQRLQKELQNEKQEKEGIVALVEELLSIQASSDPPEKVEEKMRGSVRRASSLGLNGRAGGLRSGIEKMGMGAKRAEKELKE
ncbi:central kinetochore-associated-domain-containing protein [Trichophaea hybrida]|nr:central kinetochore-associated-domain-containing protein [Trichophaea hybrida]